MLRRSISLIAITLLLGFAGTGMARLVADFETGLDGWVPNDWDNPPSVLSLDPTGATTGNLSLRVNAPRAGWTIAALVKFQHALDEKALAAMTANWLNSKYLEVDITIDPAEWVGSPEGWAIVELLSNSQNGGWSPLPVVSDSVNPGFPGGWDPKNFPEVQTRRIVYDLSAVNAKMKAAGGPGAWFEIFLIVNSGGFPKGGTVYLDNIRLTGAPSILWVSFHPDGPSAAAAGVGFKEAPDKGYTDLLLSAGYEVTRYVSTGTPDLSVVNAADLVIISRSASSAHYQNFSADTWNSSVTAPMIICHGYALRKNRMGFTTGNTMPDTVSDITLKVTDPTHPIFEGVELVDGVMVNPYAGIVTYPEGTTPAGTLARGISINSDPLDDEAILIADISAASVAAGNPAGMVIAEWPAGATLVHDGGVGTNVLGGPRLVLLTGSREASGVHSDTAGMYDLYPDGAKIFLNAVKYMLNRPIPIPLVNPSFEQPGVGKIKGWNGEGIDGTPAVDIPGWASDGAPVDSGVETGWGATDGQYTGFLKAKDPMVYQLTDYIIKAGDVFTLKVDAKNNWQATKFMLILYYDDMGLPLPVATAVVDLTAAMKEYTLVFAANTFPDCIGNPIGISFANSSPVVDSWVGFDNVRLSVKSAK